MSESSLSKELLYAILSMDAYNRGYGAAMTVPGVSLGSVTFKPIFGERADWESYGFYGAVYDVTNEGAVEGLSCVNQVISFRGTDDFSNDIPYGCSIYFGFNGGSGPPRPNHGDLIERYLTALRTIFGIKPSAVAPSMR
jgi:hypothetical protein